MKTIFSILSVAALMVTTACIKKTETTPGAATSAQSMSATPQEAVQGFVNASASVKTETDKEKLQAFCIGEMRRAFERMTPEAFKMAYMNTGLRIRKFQLLNTKTQGETATVSYLVEVDNPQGSDATVETNQRVVELTQSQGGWFIDAIRPQGSDKIAFTRGMIF